MSKERVSESRRAMARLAAIDGRLSQLAQEESALLAERAKLWSGEAGDEQPIDLRTGAKARRAPRPAPVAQVTDIDKVRAQQALRANEMRRRSK